jgi:hypothetical protein
VVEFTTGSRGKVPGKTREKRRNNNNDNNNYNNKRFKFVPGEERYVFWCIL